MTLETTVKPITFGITAAGILLAVYFLILTLVSDWNFARDQFSEFWYFVVSLAAGFGIQIGLYTYLRRAIHAMHSKTPGRTVAVTGTTSTVAMISCCAHYLANIVPILGIAGALTLVGQYQKELFWVGLAFNAAGILYIGKNVLKFKKEMV